MWITILAILETKKFVAAFLTAIAALVARWGFMVDVTTILVVMTPIMAAIGAQGWADSGKEAAKVHLEIAKINAKAANDNLSASTMKQAGFARVGLMMIIALVGIGLLAAPSCSGNSPGPVIGSVMIDCTLKNGDTIANELKALKDAFDQTGSWSTVENEAKSAGMEIGGCALSELVQAFLGGRSAPPKAQGQAARAALEDFRASVANGATFHTKDGNL